MDREKLKSMLGDRYVFQKHMSKKEIREFQKSESELFEFKIAASLTVGYVKIEAVLFKNDGKLCTGYDVFVRDKLEGDEWICYDSSDDCIEINESDMFETLDKMVLKNGLSYTECKFENIHWVEENRLKEKLLFFYLR